MEPEITKIILELLTKNTYHVDVLNREMGGVLAQIEIIKWFIGVNVIAWVGLIVSSIWKAVFKK